jgi:hypothetical protein
MGFAANAGFAAIIIGLQATAVTLAMRSDMSSTDGKWPSYSFHRPIGSDDAVTAVDLISSITNSGGRHASPC